MYQTTRNAQSFCSPFELNAYMYLICTKLLTQEIARSIQLRKGDMTAFKSKYEPS